jgi:hypothetical protein
VKDARLGWKEVEGAAVPTEGGWQEEKKEKRDANEEVVGTRVVRLDLRVREVDCVFL